ncbi:MAG TPA: hypothetical protein VFA78_07915, partial [Chloroflexota bacterium]|nr:hypothetical protein [Chloroflexota bacterium]
VESVLAGNDLVLTDRWEASHEALTRAVLEGHLSETRLREAADRVRAVKQLIFGPALARPNLVDVDAAQATVKTHDHTRVAERIGAASITLVDGALTPPSGRPLIIATRMARRFGAPVEAELRAGLAAAGWTDVDVLMVDPFPDSEQADRATRLAREAGWAALLHFNRVQSFDPESVLTSDELISLAESVTGAGVPLAVVSMGSPYALPLFVSATARLCSYSTCDASLYATLQVLRGTVAPAGQLPVSLQVT